MDSNLTKEQVLTQYGDLKLKFSGYYKFSFSFRTTAPDGAIVYASIGGSADDIYRFSVDPDTTITLRDAGYSYASVKQGEREVWHESNW